jgi:hypothetical protein
MVIINLKKLHDVKHTAASVTTLLHNNKNPNRVLFYPYYFIVNLMYYNMWEKENHCHCLNTCNFAEYLKNKVHMKHFR